MLIRDLCISQHKLDDWFSRSLVPGKVMLMVSRSVTLTSRLPAFLFSLQTGQFSPAPCKQPLQPECPQLRAEGARMMFKHTQHVNVFLSAWRVVSSSSSASSVFKAKVGTEFGAYRKQRRAKWLSRILSRPECVSATLSARLTLRRHQRRNRQKI